MCADTPPDIPTLAVLDDRRGSVTVVYVLLGVTAILSAVPTVTFFLLTLLLFGVILALAGYFRRTTAHESLTSVHMTYIIRTVWLATLLGVLLLIPASMYVFNACDTDPLQACLDRMSDAASNGQEPDTAVVMQCVQPFMDANTHMLTMLEWLLNAPVALYMLWRFFNGLLRARQGRTFNNVNRWL